MIFLNYLLSIYDLLNFNITHINHYLVSIFLFFHHKTLILVCFYLLIYKYSKHIPNVPQFIIITNINYYLVSIFLLNHQINHKLSYFYLLLLKLFLLIRYCLTIFILIDINCYVISIFLSFYHQNQ